MKMEVMVNRQIDFGLESMEVTNFCATFFKLLDITA